MEETATVVGELPYVGCINPLNIFGPHDSLKLDLMLPFHRQQNRGSEKAKSLTFYTFFKKSIEDPSVETEV